MLRTPRTLALVLALAALGWFLWSRRDREPRVPDTGLKVVVIGLDGAHLGLLSPLLEAGRLPNLRAFLEKASIGVMNSPVQEGFTSPALWTTMVTGLEPFEHGVTDFVLPDPATCKDVASASGHRTAPALWNILDGERIRSAIVGLWATWPAEDIEGAIVSDHVTYSRMRLSTGFKNAQGEEIDYHYDTASRNVSPARLDERVTSLVKLPGDVTVEDLRLFIPDLDDQEAAEILAGEYTNFLEGADPFQELKVTLQSDRSYAEIGAFVDAELDPSLLMVYLEGIDVIEHGFWPYHDPNYPRELPLPRERYAEVLTRYVEMTDRLIQKYLEMASEDTVVIVVSDHGFTTIDNPKHPFGRWHDDNAIFFAAGGPIKPRHILKSGSVSLFDVTPTILTLLGLPVGEDMPGRVVEEIFEPAFLEAHPVRKIASHGRRALNPGDIAESAVDGDIRNRLGQIAYVSAVSGEDLRGDPVDVSKWWQTRSIFGRLATDCDVATGRAVFTSPPQEGLKPGKGPIPRCAIYTDKEGVEWPAIVIQIEGTPSKTRIGLRLLDGTAIGATPERVEYLPEGPDDRFL